MARKKTTYPIRCFFEDGTTVTKATQHLTRVNQEVAEFQSKIIIKQLNEMPKEVGEIILKRLVATLCEGD